MAIRRAAALSKSEALLFNIVCANCTDSIEHERIVSVRPCKNRLVEADS
jgi:hypothetical protein